MLSPFLFYLINKGQYIIVKLEAKEGILFPSDLMGMLSKFSLKFYVSHK